MYPAKVESVILECPGVTDRTVFDEHNPITDQIVCADIFGPGAVSEHVLRQPVKRHCSHHPERFKVPVKVAFVDRPIVGDGLKRHRPRITQQKTNRA
jgi:acyl-coenzyme A synthetase/AMP-(fatty) acid ligase